VAGIGNSEQIKLTGTTLFVIRGSWFGNAYLRRDSLLYACWFSC